MARRAGQNEIDTAYRDLKANAWYSTHADYVVSKGLMQSTSATEFSPNEPLSRAILWRHAQMTGLNVAANGTSMPDPAVQHPAWRP